jgi:UDP-2,3-diacylglucosamine hydrolase
MSEKQNRAIFISDMHLGTNPPGSIANREHILLQQLESWEHNLDLLVIVGDAFEFWMEYRYYIPKMHFRFLCALTKLAQSGTQIHYIGGNHDFHLEPDFFASIGVHVHSDWVFTWHNQTIYCTHGDGQNPQDSAYRIARKILHNPFNIFLFKLLHPDWGMKLAKLVGGSSRKAQQHKPVNELAYIQAATRLMQAHQAQIVLMGHTHQAAITQTNAGLYINTGQWLQKLQYIEAVQNQFFIREVTPLQQL